jgi:serine/threonine protein kinase
MIGYPYGLPIMCDDTPTMQRFNTFDFNTAGGTPHPLPGTDFPSGYTKHEQVGCGGMGVVFRASDIELGRDVAVKLLRDDQLAGKEGAKRFLEEGCLMARLQHPNIPPVHCIGKLPGGRPFLVMKLIKGKTLKELLEAETVTDANDEGYIAVFEAVCRAVAYAHDRNVIHRDLKPGNVMVGAFGEVQVMDWGLAKVLDESAPAPVPQPPDTGEKTNIRSPRDPADEDTQAGAGTAAYMSPEQAKGEREKILRPSDVFSLGAILCRIFTGTPPYIGSDRVVTAKAICGDTAEALSRLDICGADKELVALAKECLEVDAAKRPKNAGEVANRVAAWRETAAERARKVDREYAVGNTIDKIADMMAVREIQIRMCRDQESPNPAYIPSKAEGHRLKDLGQIFWSDGHRRAARKVWELWLGVCQYRARSPQDVDAQRELLECYNALGDRERGIGDYAKAIEFYQAGITAVEQFTSGDDSAGKINTEEEVSTGVQRTFDCFATKVWYLENGLNHCQEMLAASSRPSS